MRNPTIKVPKRQAKPAGGRPVWEKRAAAIAISCTVGLFVFLGAFLFLDTKKVEQRDAALASSGAVTRAPLGAAPSGRGDTPLPDSPAPSPRSDTPPPAANVSQANIEPPNRAPSPAPDNSQALNETLKAASMGNWDRVDQLVEQGVSAAAGSSQAPDRTLAEKGKQAIAAGDYGKAEESLRAAIADHPDDAEALNELAFALLREGKLEDAQLRVTRSLVLDPAHAATWANAAEIMAERDNPVASQAALRVAIHLTRDPERARRFLSQSDRAGTSAKFRAVIGEVLPQFASIPKARSSAP